MISVTRQFRPPKNTRLRQTYYRYCLFCVCVSLNIALNDINTFDKRHQSLFGNVSIVCCWFLDIEKYEFLILAMPLLKTC